MAGKVIEFPSRPADDAPLTISPRGVEMLQDLLDEARAGRVAGFAVVWFEPEGDTGYSCEGPRGALLGMLGELSDELRGEAEAEAAALPS